MSASSIIRAVSQNPEGPYSFVETVIPVFAHNPTIRRTNDGTYLLFMIGDGTIPSPPPHCDSENKSNDNYPRLLYNTGDPGPSIHVATSQSINGPWTVHPSLNFTNWNSSATLDCDYSNPSPLLLSNGSIMLAFTAGYCHSGKEFIGVAIADHFLGPYRLTSDQPILPTPWYCVAGFGEDAFLWQDIRGSFHILYHGMCYAPFDAKHAFSVDGINWKLSKNDPYSYLVEYIDGDSNLSSISSQTLYIRMERPQLIFNETNQAPILIVNGVCENLQCLNKPGKTWTLIRPIRH
ncbi:unnamed protein product [Didymodactylos carnosus]|uniref:Glycoside hydrolase family 43 protein n=2 Tax=Didymodactylos carnosus TaxID=1234261 RepID=A0A8S2S4K0_9BILA|nr:unnamed protein product [Didymodactylos carnosus]CAF4208131.1 unnamed protein product [Didymodactylos carnosus]